MSNCERKNKTLGVSCVGRHAWRFSLNCRSMKRWREAADDFEGSCWLKVTTLCAHVGLVQRCRKCVMLLDSTEQQCLTLALTLSLTSGDLQQFGNSLNRDIFWGEIICQKVQHHQDIVCVCVSVCEKFITLFLPSYLAKASHRFKAYALFTKSGEKIPLFSFFIHRPTINTPSLSALSLSHTHTRAHTHAIVATFVVSL